METSLQTAAANSIISSQVFLDEKQVVAAPVPFPRHVSESLTRCSIGCDFDGQTSGVLVFSRAADVAVIAPMLRRLAKHAEGVSNDVGCKRCPSDPDLWVDPATVSPQERLKTKLLGSRSIFLAALLPHRTISGLCLEPHNGYHATLRRDKTHAWSVHTAHDAIKSIGGTSTLLPLAWHLLSDSTGASTAQPRASSATGKSVDIILSVLICFLRGSIVNQVR